MNAERILIAAESIGDGGWFIERSVEYANQRIVFDRPIGQNQGVQFPIAQAYADLRAADLMRWQAAQLFDSERPCGAEANMAKMLAADAAWEAANVCLQTHGGFGFAREHDVERKFREAKLYQIAPVSNNLVLSYLAAACVGVAAFVLSNAYCVSAGVITAHPLITQITVQTIAYAPATVADHGRFSLEQAIAAPLATRHLADLGARVIKVERPGQR